MKRVLGYPYANSKVPSLIMNIGALQNGRKMERNMAEELKETELPAIVAVKIDSYLNLEVEILHKCPLCSGQIENNGSALDVSKGPFRREEK